MNSQQPPPSRPADLKRIGRYRIVRPLSKGGMALVYEARRESIAGIAPRVAIKLILPEHANSETFRDLFINEARLGASMEHQNLVKIQDFDSDGDRFFLVMEYVEGLTLRRIISLATKHKLQLPLTVIVEMGRQVCDGLHYAHQAKDEHGRHLRLVHRDIKPSNLIFNDQGILKILDFGISKGVLREERRGSVKGTWGYMAPEQAHGLDVSPATDVFGIAVVLYELATLKPMFRGKGQDEIRRLLKDDHAVRMSATLPDAYAPLIPILVRALQRDAAARYPTAEAFGQALSALQSDPVSAHSQSVEFFSAAQALVDGGIAPANLRRPMQTNVPGTTIAPPPEDKPNKTATTNAATLALLTILLGMLIGISWLIWQNETEINPVAVRGAPEVTVDEPAGPAGIDAPGEQTTKPKSIKVAIDRTQRTPPATEGDEGETLSNEEAPPPQEVLTGTITIGSIQAGSEVYIDGQFIRKVPVRRTLEPGSYDVTIIAPDGRRKSFRAAVREEKNTRRVWDFDRGGWR